MGEKIELRFPVGFHTLLLGHVRQIDMMEFPPAKGMVTKTIDLLTGCSIQSTYLAIFLLRVLTCLHFPHQHKLAWVQWHISETSFTV